MPMKRKSIYNLLIITIFIISFFIPVLSDVNETYGSSPSQKPLKTEEAKPGEVKGIFTLILFGHRYSDDVETIAILDLEGDKYTFQVYKPEYDYKIKKKVPAKKALAEAEKFVSFHYLFHRSQLSKILDTNGKTIGYELRPLYLPYYYGVSDILDVNYWPEENNIIKVTIRLLPSIERSRFHGGGGIRGIGGGM
jgi:hypothetical protein